MSNYYTSPSGWFLLANKDEHRLMFFERQAIYGDYDLAETSINRL